MQVLNAPHAAYSKKIQVIGCKKSPSVHHRTILLGYILAPQQISTGIESWFCYLRDLINSIQERAPRTFGCVAITLGIGPHSNRCVIITGTPRLLWPPYVIGGPLYFCPVVSFLLSSFCLFFSSPNLSGRRSDVCHTSTHGVALVRI